MLVQIFEGLARFAYHKRVMCRKNDRNFMAVSRCHTTHTWLFIFYK